MGDPRRRGRSGEIRFRPSYQLPDRAEEWLESGTMLRRLRSLAPSRPLGTDEALWVAERQATRLLSVLGVDVAPVPLEVLAQLSRVDVAFVANIPVAGASVWGGGLWRITVEATLPPGEQRMVVGHEFKHIVDYVEGFERYRDASCREAVADYFARCLFMPRPWVKQAAGERVGGAVQVAAMFDVPVDQAQQRLLELGLTDERPHQPSFSTALRRLMRTRRMPL